ncbi:MAG: MBL fold metallo-hydrolase [Chloroflexota bacterium]
MSVSVFVGNVEIVPLLDVDGWHLAGFFPSAPRDQWAAYRQRYPGSLCDGEGGICVAATDFVLRSDGKTVLVDTGVGPGPHARLGGRSGQLLEDLQRHGIAPGDIDIVVITHLHFDNVGWNAIEGPDGYRETVVHDSRGLPVLLTDALGGRSQLGWTAQGQLISRTDCSGNTTRYGYDARGYLQTQTDERLNLSALYADGRQVAIYAYNPNSSDTLACSLAR